MKTDDYVSRYEVAEIDRAEQVLICERLDKLFEIIKFRQHELQIFDDLIKARFVEMFGDPVSNSMNLPEATLPELGEFGRGVSKHRPRNAPELLGGAYPLVQTGEVAASDLYIMSLLEPGGISHSETNRNSQFWLKRKGQCTSFSFL